MIFIASNNLLNGDKGYVDNAHKRLAYGHIASLKYAKGFKSAQCKQIRSDLTGSKVAEIADGRKSCPKKSKVSPEEMLKKMRVIGKN